MDANQLLTSAVEMGLDLLEKQSTFVAYCKAVNANGELFIYSPASDSDKSFTESEASENVRSSVLKDLQLRALIGVAFCHHTRIRFADSDEMVPAVEVELHYRGQPPVMWYFPYKKEGKTVEVLEYFTSPANEDLFAE